MRLHPSNGSRKPLGVLPRALVLPLVLAAVAAPAATAASAPSSAGGLSERDRLADRRFVTIGQRAEPSGLVRLTCPVGLLHVNVGPMLADFMVLHPKVHVHLEASNRRVDLVYMESDEKKR